MLAIGYFERVIEAIYRYNLTALPVTIFDVHVDGESIQIGLFYSKKMDLEVDLRSAAKAQYPHVLYRDYESILNTYFD